MHFVVWQRRIIAVLGIALCLLAWSGTPGPLAGAASLSISGIAEGSVVHLPESATTTNLFVSLTGTGNSPQAELSLEWRGTLLRRLTSNVPGSVLLANLPAGKFFLEARDLVTPSVAADLSFDLQPVSLQPANDSWAQAVVVSGFNMVTWGTNVHATREPGEPTPFANGAGRTVWWSWQAVAAGVVTVTTAGSSFDTTLAVFTGASVSNLTLVGSNDDAGMATGQFSQVTFNTAAGTRYFFVVDGAIDPDGASAAGIVQVRVVQSAPPTIAVLAPADGAGILVPNATSTTNVSVVVNVGEPVGRMEYWFDGPTGSRHGEVGAPYQFTLTNLFSGDYVLTIGVSNSVGLVRCVDVRFPILSLAPEIQLTDAPEYAAPSLPLAITGLKGTNYTIERSENLAAWSAVVSWTNFPGAEKVLLERNGESKGQFFRGAAP